MEPDPTLRQRTRERMAALGIPAGTDNPKLLALGAEPLPGEPMSDDLREQAIDAMVLASCEHGGPTTCGVCWARMRHALDALLSERLDDGGSLAIAVLAEADVLKRVTFGQPGDALFRENR